MYVICRIDNRDHLRCRQDGLPIVLYTFDEATAWIEARPFLAGVWYARKLDQMDWADQNRRISVKRSINQGA